MKRKSSFKLTDRKLPFDERRRQSKAKYILEPCPEIAVGGNGCDRYIARRLWRFEECSARDT